MIEEFYKRYVRFYSPQAPKQVALWKWEAVQITRTTAMQCRNISSNNSLYLETNLSCVAVQSLNVNGAFYTFWQTKRLLKIFFKMNWLDASVCHVHASLSKLNVLWKIEYEIFWGSAKFRCG